MEKVKSKSVFNTFHLGILSSFPLLLVMQQVPAWEATLEKFKEEGNCKGKEATGAPLGRVPLTEAPWRSKQLLMMPQWLLSVQQLEFLILSSSFLVWFLSLHTSQKKW